MSTPTTQTLWRRREQTRCDPRARSRALDAESLLDDPRAFPGKKKYYN